MDTRVETTKTRPKRSVSRQNYREMVNLRIPKYTKVSTKCANGVTKESGQAKEPRSGEGKLYRLQIVERDSLNELVKVRYVGYDNSYDEWRPESDIVDLSEEDYVREHGDTNPRDTCSTSCNFSGMTDGSPRFEMQAATPYNLYEELLLRIKSLLCSHRKGDPVCCISMGFDTIHFDGLARRAMLDKKPQQNVYTLTMLTKLDDVLGSRWYIRN